MDITEITAFKTGIDKSGVNYLSPSDAFETLRNGFVYRQELQSRKGFRLYSNSRLENGTGSGLRVMGIFENFLPSGTKQLLVIDQEFLYSYDEGTNHFDKIPFNSAVPIGSFGIVSPEEYVSGTTYLTKTGTQRFVFTGKGMSDVYFYDGTDVKRFTNQTDNPEYENPLINGVQQQLNRATKVMYFNNRLTLFSPVINSVEYRQRVLFTAINDASGNGDKFNQPGAGHTDVPTDEHMQGTTFLGEEVIMLFDSSNWVLQSTTNIELPNVIRKIPSVLGTDASFSTVSYDHEVKSIGKTGMITTDGRQNLRFDNKLPDFTADVIDQEKFDYTYGGFDRANGQFLFSYRDTTSNLDDDTQDKVLVYNYEFSLFSINDQRFSVFGQSERGQNLVWNQIDETKNISWARWDTTLDVWNKIGVTRFAEKTLAGDNEGYIYELNTDFDDYYVPISSITQASPAVFGVLTNLGASAFKAGDEVLITNVEGMTEVNGRIPIPRVVSSTDTSITLNIDSTSFAAYTGSGFISKQIEFAAKSIPFNPYRESGRKVYIAHIEFLLDTATIFPLEVKIFADEEDDAFKTVELTPDTTLARKREWIDVTVNQESNFITFSLKKKSGLEGTIISSIRIYSKPGALTGN